MRKRSLIGVAVGAGLAAAVAGYAPTAAAQSGDDDGPRPGMMREFGYGMGPGMMGGGGMGPGMMGGGGGMMGGPGMMGGDRGMMGPWMMGPNFGEPVDLDLSVGEVQKYFQRWIAVTGNEHIKVGNVVETSKDAITTDIVTTDKEGLVQRFSVDRHTGRIRIAG